MKDNLLLLVIVALVVTSHGLAGWPFVRKLLRRELPSSIDFCCMALVLYYDLGLGYELAGALLTSPYYGPFALAKHGVQWQAACIMALAPLLLRLGDRLSRPGVHRPGVLEKSTLLPKRKREFYLLCLIVTLVVSAIGGWLISSGIPLWQLREATTEQLGALIAVVYIPMGLLAFYIAQTDSLTRHGMAVTFFLIIAAVLGSYPVAERTNFLLPFLIVLLFYKQLPLSRYLVIIGIGLVAAALLLPAFKWQYAFVQKSTPALIGEMVYMDLAKPPLLADVIQRSVMVGTKILPYPGAGYLYSLFFYAPRWAVPFKGYSSAVYYTSEVAHSAPDATHWGLAIGGIEEMVLNFGVLLCLPLLIFYGVFIGLFDDFSRRAPVLIVPTRLGAVWVIGQHLPALLLIFGTMTGVIWLLHWRYVQRETLQC